MLLFFIRHFNRSVIFPLSLSIYCNNVNNTKTGAPWGWVKLKGHFLCDLINKDSLPRRSKTQAHLSLPL